MAPHPRAQLRADYSRWHHLQVDTGDLDPVYPVLRALADPRSAVPLTPDRLAWLCLLHVAYYHLGSALAAFCAVPDPAPPTDPLLHLPCSTERRGNRAPDRLKAHWLSLLAAVEDAGGPHAWLTDLTAPTPDGRWTELNGRVQQVYGNGRWAAYKTAELAQKVCGAPVEVADAGHRNSTGPRHGLALLRPVPTGNDEATITALDRITADLARALGEPDLGQVETSLCDFHGLVTGRYYLGHDIDAMQAQLAAVPSDLTGDLLAARWAALPHPYLGELGGWHGVDADRRRVYAATGSIVERR